MSKHFGLNLVAGKKVAVKVEEGTVTHISTAAIASAITDKSKATLIVHVDGKQKFVLANLSAVIPHASLDSNFSADDTVELEAQGGNIDVTGYTEIVEDEGADFGGFDDESDSEEGQTVFQAPALKGAGKPAGKAAAKAADLDSDDDEEDEEDEEFEEGDFSDFSDDEEDEEPTPKKQKGSLGQAVGKPAAQAQGKPQPKQGGQPQQGKPQQGKPQQGKPQQQGGKPQQQGGKPQGGQQQGGKPQQGKPQQQGGKPQQGKPQQGGKPQQKKGGK